MDENLKAVSTTVLISISYLINFAREEFPVKNDIKILLKSSEAMRRTINPAGNVIISIDTNKFTWAEDILNNFSSYIEGRFKKKSFLFISFGKATDYARSSYLAILTICGCLMVLFFSYIDDVSNFNSQIRKVQMESLSGDSIASANAKLNYLMTMSSSGVSFWNIQVGFKYLLYLGTAILLLNALPTAFLRLTGKSYVSIGQVSEEKNDTVIRRRKFLLNTVAFGSVVSLLCNIFSSYIYDFFKTAF